MLGTISWTGEQPLIPEPCSQCEGAKELDGAECPECRGGGTNIHRLVGLLPQIGRIHMDGRQLVVHRLWERGRQTAGKKMHKGFFELESQQEDRLVDD